MVSKIDSKQQVNWGNQSMVVLTLNLTKTELQDDYNFEDAIRLLPIHDQANILRKKFRNDQIRHLCNKLLQYFGCLVMVNNYDDKSLSQLKFIKGRYGKPMLQSDKTNISFSMSNGEENVCMFIWNHDNDSLDHEVGIDIASINDLQNKEELELYIDIFTEEEYLTLLNCPKDEIQKLFAYYWSLKECYTKYLGTGLNFDLKKVDIGPITKDETNISKRINGSLIQFQTFWVPPKGQELISICYNQVSLPNNENIDDKVGDYFPTIVEISFEELINYLKSH